ncbi:TetR/AcrR family transcriptional regulator [Lactococcus lactis]|jgi:AcrR family transcriptional regulator|uniref:TetR/AcrR family transcriptional regulator n=1 Tax=Lactococcus TaxID=1357 RepID=UPI00223B3A7A|nr:TetR/AcrR family transcriptional regulator [Lactococcus lactis]MCT0016438.1 TetR/AcrR family transcriptional regulator [Lactococcus lactis subsp. lactis]MDT2866591.1 TetR/AcrR family transcriptional regulator [Lactococcus lactis]MDT2870406.1 TetR/AcrR family transcriptional regulator [Lactococcus lactis]MDT2872747.1 TetR/AcrR family transcriptional regulator [Lactococcus lactis]MDT2883379.1 TetR/AcrR family transcriptional regulator [Lactococcus lactis]
MRKIDENKKEAITQAVFQLTKEVGLVGLSIAKVAKIAGVSPATIYVYYKDKADMLSQILIGVKDILDEGQEEIILSVSDPLEQFKKLLRHLIHQWTSYPKHAIFMRAALENPSEIAPQGLAYSNQRAEVTVALYERLLASGKIKPLSQNLLISWTAGGIMNNLMYHIQMGTEPDNVEIEQMIQLSVDAIKK